MHAKGRTNCPNCGAPIDSTQCPYCKTSFYDFGAIEVGKPAWFRFKVYDRVYIFKGMSNASFEFNNPMPERMFYADNKLVEAIIPSTGPNITVNLEIQSIGGIELDDPAMIVATSEALK